MYNEPSGLNLLGRTWEERFNTILKLFFLALFIFMIVHFVGHDNHYIPVNKSHEYFDQYYLSGIYDGYEYYEGGREWLFNRIMDDYEEQFISFLDMRYYQKQGVYESEKEDLLNLLFDNGIDPYTVIDQLRDHDEEFLKEYIRDCYDPEDIYG